MKVRTQIFLFVAPLFISCGTIGSALAWRLQTEELDRSFRAETRALAVTLAEFTEPGDAAALAAGRPLARTRLAAVLERLERWAVLRRFFLIDTKSGRVLADTARNGATLPTPGQWRSLAGDDVLLLPLHQAEPGDERQSFVALTAGGAAAVGGELSANEYLEARGRIGRDAIAHAVLSALVCLGIAAAIALFVDRQIRRLRAAVETIDTPEFPREQAGSVVQEIDDLGNTMNVMHSVFSDTAEKARNLLLESERYRSERGLAVALQSELQAAPLPVAAGVEAAWFAGGEASSATGSGGPPAAFAGLVETAPGRGAAFVGLAGPAGAFDPVLRAHAARAYLADLLKRERPEAAGAGAADLFGLTRVAVAWWDQATLSRWSPEVAGAETVAWPGGTLSALGCLGPVNQERLAVYLTNFSGRSPAQAAAELPALFDPAEAGAALVLRRSAT